MNAPQPNPPKMDIRNQFAPTLPRAPRHGLSWSSQCVNDDIHHCRVAIVDHLERISPTGWLVLLALSHVRSGNRCHLPMKVETTVLGHRNPDGHSTSNKGTHCHTPSSCAHGNPIQEHLVLGVLFLEKFLHEVRVGTPSTLNPCLYGGRQ